jgi:hypothetical protein
MANNKISNNKKSNKKNATNPTLVVFNNKFDELNSSIIAELLEQNFSGITIEKRTGDDYYCLYKETKISQFGWNEVIDTKNTDLLKYANELRKKYVNELLELIIIYLASSCRTSKSPNIVCQTSAVGSTALTSNYDVTVTSFLVGTIIVEEFNKYFFKFWNDTSGKIFDTNFYGNSFFFNIMGDIPYNAEKYKLLYNQTDNEQKFLFYLPPKDLDETIKNSINRMQLKWLILKIYLHKKECNINNINNKNNKNKLLIDNFKNIEKIILDYIKKIYNIEYDIKNLQTEFNLLNEEKKNIEENIKKNQKITENNKDNYIRKAFDELYVSKLHIMDINNQNYESSTNLNNEIRYNLLEKLIDSVLLCNFFGNETYFCMGTIYHVVGHIQGLGNFEMSSEYYVQSMLENLIDVFRYCEKINNDNFKFVLKASKYIFRIYDAIQKYLEIPKIESLPSEETKKNNTKSNRKIENKKQLFSNIRNFYKAHANSTTFELNTTKTIESRITELFKSYNKVDKLLEMIISDIESTILA